MHGKARLKHVVSLFGYQVMHTSVVERHTGTSRLRKQRQGRKTLACAKATRSHRWMRGLAVGRDNVCRAHRSLKSRGEVSVAPRIPAMPATVADHIWSTWEW